MKILYAIQGTGNGHISRAVELIPHFQKHGEVDILISGIQSDLKLPFELKYQFKGLSFVFGKKGGVDLLNTYLKNHIQRFIAEVRTLPVEQYDLIINDFEPISAWAAYFKKKACIALSNQAATEFPEWEAENSDDKLGKFILRHYAPSTSNYGFHYRAYSEQIYTPVIRKKVRELTVTEEDHITVYLPSFSEQKLMNRLKLLPDTKFQVFSKHSRSKIEEGNVSIMPINEESFLKSFSACRGLITAAGFGATSEALFLGKKLLVIPQKQQYEQLCNAAALEGMGVQVMKKFKKKNLPKVEKWIKEGKTIKLEFPDQSKEIVQTIINNEYYHKDPYLEYLTVNQFQLA